VRARARAQGDESFIRDAFTLTHFRRDGEWQARRPRFDAAHQGRVRARIASTRLCSPAL